MSNEQQAIFSGTISQCFQHFSESYQKDSPEARRLADFVGVNWRKTVLSWLSGKYLPDGMRLLSVYAFFSLAGYSVCEWDRLDQRSREVMLNVVAGLVTLDDIAHYVNLKPHYVLACIRKSTLGSMNQDSLEKLDELNEMYEAEREEFVRNFEPLPVPSCVVFQEVAVPSVQCSVDMTDVSEKGQLIDAAELESALSRLASVEAALDVLREDVSRALSGDVMSSGSHSDTSHFSISSDPVLSLAVLLSAAHPIAQVLLVEEGSENRQRLRELMGRDGLLRFSTALNRLCGEQARSRFQSNGTINQQ